MKQLLRNLALAASVQMAFFVSPVHANEELADSMNSYLEFVEYSGSTIQPKQIPKENLLKFFIIDARDAGQFEKGRIPGATNIEWRQVVSRRSEIPKEKPVMIYSNTGSLSAQAGFALRVLGYENVLILQDGFEGWKVAQK